MRDSAGRRRFGDGKCDAARRSFPVCAGAVKPADRAGISRVNFLSGSGIDGDAERSPLRRKPDGPRVRECVERGERRERHRDAEHGTRDRDPKAAARRRFRSSCRSIDEIAADRCARRARVTCRRPDRVRASGHLRGRRPCVAGAPGAHGAPGCRTHLGSPVRTAVRAGYSPIAARFRRDFATLKSRARFICTTRRRKGRPAHPHADSRSRELARIGPNRPPFASGPTASYTAARPHTDRNASPHRAADRIGARDGLGGEHPCQKNIGSWCWTTTRKCAPG